MPFGLKNARATYQQTI
jgi:hypothetical protein